MTHYLNGITITMYCDHPEMEGNNTTSVGCDGNCQECKFGKAEMSIADCMELLNKTRNFRKE